ncbi:hypothetical protein GQ53DRAFT_846790 [Thozetella sp. PMI_491]|nr:hypothetical protein GQ53DRAFT_846790 [Thozetella sp. PMI_491]
MASHSPATSQSTDLSTSPSSPLTSNSSPQPLQQVQETGSKQCWECLRRRIVCDRWQPVCNKCQLAKIVCPGYGDHKPLTWLTPGKVLSRTRKRKSPRGAPARSKGQVQNEGLQPPLDPSQPVAVGLVPRQEQPPQISHILELTEGTAQLFQAAAYYNAIIYPEVLENHLGPNMFIVPFELVHAISASKRHLMVAFTISHYLLRLPDGAERVASSELAIRLHHHRGEGIRALNQELGTEMGRFDDSAITSVLLLMFSDVQQFVSGNWSVHAAAIAQMIASRGGINQLVKTETDMRPVYLSYIICVIMGNTTTPAANQMMEYSRKDIIDLFVELHAEIVYFPQFPCPLTLFCEIIHINELRHQVATAVPSADFGPYRLLAREILDRIVDFDPKSWSESHEDFQPEWLVMGRLCQSTLVLYCLCSLRSLFDASSSLRMKHRSSLFLELGLALESPRLRRCVMWPLVVAGMLAVEGSWIERDWVEKELCKMTQLLGIYSPLVAVVLLKRFWTSGKTGWDECFHEPRVFLA